jgi:hypothetical protein
LNDLPHLVKGVPILLSNVKKNGSKKYLLLL